MCETEMLKLTQSLIKNFIINIRQIISNSDNDMDDILGEAYIVVFENYNDIIKNNRVFINRMKTRCLKNNKYGKRIESHERWSYFNNLELTICDRDKYTSEIDEDTIVGIDAIKKVITDYEYDFLIFYYENGMTKTMDKYKINNNACRQRVCRLKRKILKELNGQ